MIFSKVMEQKDYDELGKELIIVKHIAEACGGWPSVQHMHRQWEYSLMILAFEEWIKNKNVTDQFLVADVGGGIGFTTPIFAAFNCDVVMYEPWVSGDESAKFWDQVNTLQNNLKKQNVIKLENRALCNLLPIDRRTYDAAFCISTLEHIGEYQKAFIDLLSMVKQGGLVFLTTDYGDHEFDDYPHAGLRAGKMFTSATYHELIEIAISRGFNVLGYEWYYNWKEEYRMVNHYGFASLS